MEKSYKPIYKKWQSFLITIFLVIISFSSSTLAKNINMTDDLQLLYTFENPNIVKPVDFKTVQLKNNEIFATLPPKSVVVMEIY